MPWPYGLPQRWGRMYVFLSLFSFDQNHTGYDCPLPFLFHAVPFEVVACPSWCFLSSMHMMSFSVASIPSHVVPRFLVKITASQSPSGGLCTSLQTCPSVALKVAEENVRPSSYTGGKGLLISKFFLNLHFIRRATVCQTCPLSSLLSDLPELTFECARHGWSWWEGKMGGIWNIQHSSLLRQP